MAAKLYLIDGHSQIYRAYYAPFRDLTSPTGEPTRATYVFTSMLLKFLVDQQPRYLAMAVDGPIRQLRRKRIYEDYKVTRKPMPEDLPPQVARIRQIVQAMSIPILEAPGYEADDVLATIASRLAGGGADVVLISRDKDLDQVLGEHVCLYDPMTGQTLDAAGLEQAKGYRPDQAVEVQALAGDSTDNIPGVPGVGPKTAAKLIAQYGSAQGVIDHADELTPKLAQRVREHAGDIDISRKLATLERDVPLKLDLQSLRCGPIRVDELRKIFAELGFNRLMDQLEKLRQQGGLAPDGGDATAGAVAAAAPAQPGDAGQPAALERVADGGFDYQCVNTPGKLDRLVGQLAGVRRLAVDTETDSIRPMLAQLVGISLAWKPKSGVYIPVRGPLGATVLDVALVRDRLGPILSDAAVTKVGHHLKYDMIVLANAGILLAGPMFDTMIAAHVLDSSRASYKLDALAAEQLRHLCIPIGDLIGRGRNQITMDRVPLDLAATYAAEDADVSLRLADVLEAALAREGLSELFANLEMRLMPVLVGMEQAGIRVDPLVLKRLETTFGSMAQALRGRILQVAGGEFNVDSPRQLSEVLFDRLGLPVLRKTQTGRSTDSSVLEELAALHELPALVLDYRKLTKLVGTYLTSLAAFIHPRTGRVHTSFHQAGTVTGRLSSSDPNLQNIPIRTEEGRLIRSAFVAEAGHVLLSADYSQVELRVLAHFCEDPTLVGAFEADQDIHRIVAAEVFGVRPDEVTPEQRGRAKTVNFGIIYGQTAFGLALTLRISRTEAAEFIRRYRRRFPRIEEFLQSCIRAAKQQGYVETIFGRRRRIPNIDAANPGQRAAAERLAINSVVQGSAADLIKQAMVNIDQRVRRERHPARMLLQIHDELLFEAPVDAAGAEEGMIVEEMAGAIRLRVPLKVEVGVGENWMAAK